MRYLPLYYFDGFADVDRPQAECCEYGDCGICKSCEQWDADKAADELERQCNSAEDQAILDSQRAKLSPGGSRGAEWHADQHGYSGDVRKYYILAYNQELDSED
jgi:hypothetical protein